MLKELVDKARSCRRFTNTPILSQDIEDIISIACHCPSTKNIQPLRYLGINSLEVCSKVDQCINLSGLNYQTRKAEPLMHPHGYIIIMSHSDLNNFGLMDVGIAAQTIYLAAAEKNIATCCVGAFDNGLLRDALPTISPVIQKEIESNLEEVQNHATLQAYLIIALGYPAEKIQLVPMSAQHPPYWRENDIHFVQKNTLNKNLLAIL